MLLQELEKPIRSFVAPPPVPVALAIEAYALSAGYEGKLALDNISFQIPQGARVAVIGPNGAGKSTLFKLITGLMPPLRGNLRLFGAEVGSRRAVAYVPQRSQVDWTFPVSVADVVLMGRVGRAGLFSRPSRHDRQVAQQSLEQVGLASLARRQIGALSGGQQQRVFIARALAQEANLLLMDEPVTGLDLPSQEEIFTLVSDLQRHGVTVLIATHDLNQAADARRYEQVLLLNRHLIGSGPAGDVLTPDNLARAYGGHLRWVQTSDGSMALVDTCCGGGKP